MQGTATGAALSSLNQLPHEVLEKIFTYVDEEVWSESPSLSDLLARTISDRRVTEYATLSKTIRPIIEGILNRSISLDQRRLDTLLSMLESQSETKRAVFVSRIQEITVGGPWNYTGIRRAGLDALIDLLTKTRLYGLLLWMGIPQFSAEEKIVAAIHVGRLKRLEVGFDNAASSELW